MNKIVFILTCLFIFSCSSRNNENRVGRYEVDFDGGIKDSKSWDDTLQFKKISWFTGATMSHDMLISRLAEGSPFRNWLSGSEQVLVKKCQRLYVALFYSNKNDNRSIRTVKNHFERRGLKEFYLPEFTAHFKGHSTYKVRNLDDYNVVGYCATSSLSVDNHEYIQIPGFHQTKLEL